MDLKNKIITALLSGIIYSLFLALFDKFTSPAGTAGIKDFSEIAAALPLVLIVAVYAIPVFLLLGIPVSYLIDYITGKLHTRSAVKLYAAKFILYLIVAIVLFEFVMQSGGLDAFLVTSLLPILMFFNLQFFLYKEYKINGSLREKQNAF